MVSSGLIRSDRRPSVDPAALDGLRRRRTIALGAAAVLLVAVVLLAVGVQAEILLELRLPRVLLVALVGGVLAVAGATYQGVFRNPLADPYLLGSAAGAGLGATLVIAYVPHNSGPLSTVPVAA